MQLPIRQKERGYSLIEVMVVLAIIGIVALVTLPNLTKWYEKYKLRNNARGVASFLKVGRMKAVAANLSHVVAVNHDEKIQCPRYKSAGATFVMYRKIDEPELDQGKVRDCFSTDPKVKVQSFPDPSPEEAVTFRSNGMATTEAPNWFLVKSRTGRSCQMVCVNASGSVRVNRVVEPCKTPYGGPTPCKAP